MNRFIGVAALLMALLCSSVAMAANVYVVVKGDTLSGIAKANNMAMGAIKKTNPQIKYINRIKIGQKINLLERDEKSEEGAKVSAPKKASKTNDAVIKTMFWNPGSNPWKLGKVEGVKRLHFSPEGEMELIEAVQKNNHFSTAYIGRDGKVFDDFENEYRMVVMGCGKGDFFQPIPAWKDDPLHTDIEAGWIYKSENVEYVMFPFKCWNPTRIERVKSQKDDDWWKGWEDDWDDWDWEWQDEEEIPPIFKEVEVEKNRIAYRHELDAGGGAYHTSGDTHGAYAFAQYIAYLEKLNTAVAGGTLTPVVGVFAKGSRSENNETGSGRNNFGVGPQVGFEWNGVTAAGYPQCVQFMLRAIYDYTHGYNDSKGYSKEQQHALIGYYMEYLRRFHPEWMYIIYSEGWFDVAGSYTSTWSGDNLDDLTKVSIGAKLHKDISEDWAIRLGAQLGFQPQEDRLGAAIYSEIRYDNWLIFGPRFDYNLLSDIPAEVGGYAYGGFARVELRDSIIEKYTETQMQEVKPADKELLQY